MNDLELFLRVLLNLFNRVLNVLGAIYVGQFSLLTIFGTLVIIGMVLSLFWKGAKA